MLKTGKNWLGESDGLKTCDQLNKSLIGLFVILTGLGHIQFIHGQAL